MLFRVMYGQINIFFIKKKTDKITKTQTIQIRIGREII